MNELQKVENKEIATSDDFNNIQRAAKAMASSNVVPSAYQNNVANCMIAIDMANRTGMAPIMIAQNLHVIKGKPSWSSQFIIALINNSRRFAKDLKFKLEGNGETLSCYAYTENLDGEILKGTTVTMKMAKAEGWLTKPGSKWLTMPEQMIQYRAAAFFGRIHCPDLILGLQTREEMEDIQKEKTQAKSSLDMEVIDVETN